MDRTISHKMSALSKELVKYGRLAVAFSGGVDSSLLLYMANKTLEGNVLAVTGHSPSVPAREVETARSFCNEHGIEQVLVETREFELEEFDRNPLDRCYRCKRELLTMFTETAREHGYPVLAEGSNVDDRNDYRPGSKAVEELGAVSPLQEAGLTKDDVRMMARELGLDVWNKPSFACLNTRFAFGELITPEKLAMVDAAEQYLLDVGFTQVRVRMQGTSARIELLTGEFGRLMEMSEEVVTAFEALGFNYVSLDLRGYRTGSMNVAAGRGES